MSENTKSTAIAPRVIVVVALMSEARPLIDFYRLKKSCDAPFTVFSAADCYVQVVICGMGAISAATAVGYMSERSGVHDKAWLNIGIAGHRFYDVGTSVRVLSHRLEGSARKQFVSQAVAWRGSVAELITLGEVSSHYPDTELIDMEGNGFFAAAMHFNSSELIQSIKVVSDNAEYSAENLNAQAISNLVLGAREEIVGFIERLSDFVAVPIALDEWESLIEWPMSHSQRQIVGQGMLAARALNLNEKAFEIMGLSNDFNELSMRMNKLLASYSPELMKAPDSLAAPAK